MSNYRNRIGEAIAFARNVAGRSQQELADMLGRDKRTIQKWERGEIRIALEDFLDEASALARLHGLQTLQNDYPDAEFVAQKVDVTTENDMLHYRVVYTIIADICT